MEFCTEAKLIRNEDQTIEIYSLEGGYRSSDDEVISIEDLLNCLDYKKCDLSIDTSKITVLELSKCNLSEIPDSWKNLNLKHLGLAHNNLKTVPLCLYGGLKYLESLDLSCNMIENFDLEPACLPCIKKMKLHSNNFSNIPKWFLMFRCTNMEEFDYSLNKATHYSFMKNSFNVSHLKLKKLELVSSCLIDKDFPFLKCFKRLQYLNISNLTSRHMNRFFDLDQLFIKPKWEELHTLKLKNLSLSMFPEGIAWIESLKELSLSDNCLSWLPDDIKFLVNLEVLVVSNNTLISLPNNLATLQKLKILSASDNCIDTVPDFRSMSNLTVLDLFNNNLENVDFDVDNVEFVDLEYNYLDTNTLSSFSLYEEKKNGLREIYSITSRCDGTKERIVTYAESTSSESDVSLGSLGENRNVTDVGIDENENWDLPSNIIETHSDIDSEDEKWQGEAIKTRLEQTCNTKTVYVSDDDWMFEDCDS